MPIYWSLKYCEVLHSGVLSKVLIPKELSEVLMSDMLSEDIFDDFCYIKKNK